VPVLVVRPVCLVPNAILATGSSRPRCRRASLWTTANATDEGLSVDAAQRFFVALTVLGLVGFVATLGWMIFFN
jgi:hypothetical protein